MKIDPIDPSSVERVIAINIRGCLFFLVTTETKRFSLFICQLSFELLRICRTKQNGVPTNNTDWRGTSDHWRQDAAMKGESLDSLKIPSQSPEIMNDSPAEIFKSLAFLVGYLVGL